MPAEGRPAQTSDTATEKIKGISAGLFESDYNTLQALADRMSLPRSLVVRFAIQNFLQRHQAGEISLKAEEGALVIQQDSQEAPGKPGPKASKKKKKAAAPKKGKKKKKDTRPGKKKK